MEIKVILDNVFINMKSQIDALQEIVNRLLKDNLDAELMNIVKSANKKYEQDNDPDTNHN